MKAFTATLMSMEGEGRENEEKRRERERGHLCSNARGMGSTTEALVLLPFLRCPLNEGHGGRGSVPEHEAQTAARGIGHGGSDG